MGFVDKFLDLLLGEGRRRDHDALKGEIEQDPGVRNEDIPGTLDLGWLYSEDRNEFQMAKISQRDRMTHMYVVGATGAGKTKFLEFLISQDITNRTGFGVIDPHGDLVEDIKGFIANAYQEGELSERLILIDPTSEDSTVTFNPLERQEGVAVSEQVNELVSNFRKTWSDSWGARMEDLMRNSMIALSEGGYTLVELPIFLSRRIFRESLLRNVTHPITREYFMRFEAMTDRAQVTWVEPVMNKVNALLSDERIRQIFSAPKSSFDVRDAIDSKKIILIKLDKGRLKDSADLLGGLLLSKIQMAAFSRGDLPQRRRVPFILYIDEFQNFATESFSLVLSEARKYGLSLVMAHQTLAQISEELRSLILGNAGVQVYFRLNRQDASLLAKEAFRYSGREVKGGRDLSPVYWSYSEEWEKKTEELQDLPPRSCYVKHKIQGGLISIQTADIPEAWEAAEMEEGEYLDMIEGFPFGGKYLIARDGLAAQVKERQEKIFEEIRRKEDERKRAFELRQAVKQEPTVEAVSAREKPTDEERKALLDSMKPGGEKSETQHRYLQNLVKKIAEDKEYKATIEAATPDGRGRVDVLLKREDEQVACEISSTTDEMHELENLKKCLNAGYKEIIMCAVDGRKLEKIKTLVSEQLEQGDQVKILFFAPDELTSYLSVKKESIEVTRERKVRGYKVKVEGPAGEDLTRKKKRQAVAEVILKSFRRLRNEK